MKRGQGKVCDYEKAKWDRKKTKRNTRCLGLGLLGLVIIDGVVGRHGDGGL